MSGMKTSRQCGGQSSLRPKRCPPSTCQACFTKTASRLDLFQTKPKAVDRQLGAIYTRSFPSFAQVVFSKRRRESHSLTVRTCIAEPADAQRIPGKTVLFLSFPYVRPEPVLVKQCILYINGAKSAVFSPSHPIPCHAMPCTSREAAAAWQGQR